MTTNYTAFVQAYMAAWLDSCPDPDQSSWSAKFLKDCRLNVQRRGSQGLTLNTGQTSTVQIAGRAQADWLFLLVTCVGQGHINLAGVDASSSAITSSIPVYGTTTLPGIAIVSTYNLTANPIIVGDAAGSVFDVFDFTCVEDGN